MLTRCAGRCALSVVPRSLRKWPRVSASYPCFIGRTHSGITNIEAKATPVRKGSTGSRTQANPLTAHDKLRMMSKPEYWNGVYERQKDRGGNVDWFVKISSVDEVKNALQIALASDRNCDDGVNMRVGARRALDVGCGTSTVGVELARGYSIDVVECIDGSQLAIDLMRSRVPHDLDGVVRYSLADLREPLSFADEWFDVIVDKGTTDAFVHGNADVLALHEEMQRVLRPDGLVIHITDDDPDYRLPLLQRLWSCGVQEVEDGFFLYVLRKK